MKKKKNFIIKALLLFACSPFLVKGQQLSNAKMVYNPRVNTFAISGVGGGNLHEFSADNPSSSGQISIDWNIALNSKNKTYRSSGKLNIRPDKC